MRDWIRSSFCATDDCVEWLIEEHTVRVRDSKEPFGHELSLTHAEWRAFLRAAKSGEADITLDA
jgi:hypothetical protein